jgi:hypothetical protein
MSNLSLLSNGWPIKDRVPGGNWKLFISTWNETGMTFSFGTGASASFITQVGGTYSSFQAFDQELETLAFDGTPTPSLANGVLTFPITITAMLHVLDSGLAVTAFTLLKSAFRIIVQDNNGLFWMVGVNRPVRASDKGHSLGTGTKNSDLNGLKIEFATSEIAPAYQISASLIPELVVYNTYP